MLARLLEMKDDPFVSDLKFVLQDDGQMGVVWAGCFYGPEPTLEKIAEGITLQHLLGHLERMQNDPQLGTRVESCDPDDGLGVRWLPV